MKASQHKLRRELLHNKCRSSQPAGTASAGGRWRAEQEEQVECRSRVVAVRAVDVDLSKFNAHCIMSYISTPQPAARATAASIRKVPVPDYGLNNLSFLSAISLASSRSLSLYIAPSLAVKACYA